MTETAFTLTLAAPSHAVEPALLAQRLPRLAAALSGFTAVQAILNATLNQPSSVQVYAAQLVVQRDHITLESLPALDAASQESLRQFATSLAAEFAADGLAFIPTLTNTALGELNLSAALPPAANFIGRDIAKALPRTDDARVLRQFVNGAQMALHQSLIKAQAGSAVNSLWLANPLPADSLSNTWLQGGLSAWWDALPAWDAALDVNALSKAAQLQLVYSDVTLNVPLKRRAAWALWAKPLDLTQLLQANHV